MKTNITLVAERKLTRDGDNRRIAEGFVQDLEDILG